MFGESSANYANPFSKRWRPGSEREGGIAIGNEEEEEKSGLSRVMYATFSMVIAAMVCFGSSGE